MSDQLYYRPVRCKYCDQVFDFPTVTTDINERDVPVRTRTCCSCLWEMGQNEELREARAKADEAHRRSVASLTDRPVTLSNGHKSSLSSIGTSDRHSSFSEVVDKASSSPEQTQNQLASTTATDDRPEERTRPAPRPTSGVHILLN